MENKKDIIYSGYAIIFNEVNKDGRIYTSGSINEDDFKEMKNNGHIENYNIDHKGVKIFIKSK